MYTHIKTSTYDIKKLLLSLIDFIFISVYSYNIKYHYITQYVYIVLRISDIDSITIFIENLLYNHRK